MTNNTPDYEDNLYFDSQDTKNEQQKDLCITSEQLTEQWKKGELPEGFYYIKVKEVMANYPLLADCVEGLSYTYFLDYEDYVTEVLAPVPSYDEWKASEKYNKHLEEVIKVYERKDKQATETSVAYNKLAEENAQLKELLEECRRYIDIWGYTDTHGNALLPQIDEALR